MLRLSKKVEYGLMAAQYVARRQSVVSAKDIADYHQISYELVAKVLNALVRAGLMQSFHGVNGGYNLSRLPSQISVADIVHAIEGKTSIVECGHDVGNSDCTVHSHCTIKNPIAKLQERIDGVFKAMSIAELAGLEQPKRVVWLDSKHSPEFELRENQSVAYAVQA